MAGALPLSIATVVVPSLLGLLRCDIMSTNLLQTRIYYKHEAQAQVTSDDKGIRFGTMITVVCWALSVPGIDTIPEGKQRSPTPWNVRKKVEDNNEEGCRWIYLEPTPGVGQYLSRCVLSYCMFFTIFQVWIFVVIVFLLLVVTSCLYVFMKITISGACVFPPPPFCDAADWLLLAVVRELPRAL